MREVEFQVYFVAMWCEKSKGIDFIVVRIVTQIFFKIYPVRAGTKGKADTCTSQNVLVKMFRYPFVPIQTPINPNTFTAHANTIKTSKLLFQLFTESRTHSNIHTLVQPH